MLAKDNALLVSTTADLNRAKDLLDKGAGTRQAYDAAFAAQQSAQATVDADQATVDADQLQLDFTKITAPIDGRLGAVQVSVGDLVGGGSASASGGTPTPALSRSPQVDPIEVIFHLAGGQSAGFQGDARRRQAASGQGVQSGTTDLIALRRA